MDERDVLWRIAALLFALAALAERAAGLSGRRRRDMLAILSWGEAEARAYVVGMSPGAMAVIDSSQAAEGASCRAGQGAMLAARLRVLALVLWYTLTRERRRRISLGRPHAERPGRAWFGSYEKLPAPDTS